MDLIQDAPIGQLLRYLTRNKVLLYAEERPDFRFPSAYNVKQDAHKEKHHHDRNACIATTRQEDTPESRNVDLEKTTSRGGTAEPDSDGSSGNVLAGVTTVHSQIDRIHSRPFTEERFEADIAAALQKTKSRPETIVPTKTADGIILVDWLVIINSLPLAIVLTARD